MDNLFRKLSAGARFSKKDLLKEKKEEQRKSSLVKDTRADQGSALPDELDFFKKEDTPSSNNTSSPSLASSEKLKIPKKPLFKDDKEANLFRKELEIKVYGDEVCWPVKRFVDLARPQFQLPVKVVERILESGLKRPSPVQMQAAPILLSGRDAFVVAPTGSGKTLVFITAILKQILVNKEKENEDGFIKAIIISPTRELACQIKEEFRKFIPSDEKIGCVLLNKAVVNSWKEKKPHKYPQVLVSTPKRLVLAVKENIVDLSKVQQIMLDEADRLLDEGLLEQMDSILAACTFDGVIQKALVSATIPTGVEELAKTFMSQDPIRIVVGAPFGASHSISQKLVYVGQEEGKLMALQQLLVSGGLSLPAIVFCETIDGAKTLFHTMISHGISAEMIHSERSQHERERIITHFRSGKIWLLITTDLLARGLDFPEVSCVINYDFPLSTASYIHRIGRTGRGNRKGDAITFFTKQDADALRIVANVMKQSGCEVPDWMLQLERKSTKQIVKERSMAKKAKTL